MSDGTWINWLPEGALIPADDELLTRDQLLDLVTQMGVTRRISPRSLQNWEMRGILPSPVRKFHNGATRALYPRWAAGSIASIVTGRRYGKSEDDLRALAKRCVGEQVFTLSDVIQSTFNVPANEAIKTLEVAGYKIVRL